jgi:peptidoglycan/LPS O-acetylase OafA/YrhL
MKELPNLDFVRAMAVLSVVFEHILLAYGVDWLGPIEVHWIGVVGVFVFFVHTALVLMWSLERRPHTLDFYIRRVFRIYPLAIVAIVVALLFHAPVAGTVDDYFATGPRALHAVIPNLLLIENLITAPHVVSVMWSLPLEVEMYVLLPMLFFFIRRNFSLWPLFVLCGLAVLCSLQIDPLEQNLTVAIPYFLCGIMAYVGFARRKPILPAWLLPVALIVFALIFLVRPNFRGGWVLCLEVGLTLPFFRQIQSAALIRCTHEIAKYSYGIYLSHPFGIVIGIYLMPHRPLALQVAVILISTVAFAVAGYHLIEHPMIRLGARLAARAERRYEQRELAHFRPGK